MEDIHIDLENRKYIYRCISNNPGIHISELSRVLNMPKTTLCYHLRYLVQREFVTTKKEGRYKRYFIAKKVGNKDKRTLAVLREKTPRDIILYLLCNVGDSQIEISKNLNKSPKTIEFHLKKMIYAGLIERLEKKDGIIRIPRVIKTKVIEYTPVSNDAVYSLNDALYIYQILIKYKDSFKDDENVNAALHLLDYYIKIKFKEKISEKTDKNWLNSDRTIEEFYKIFPCFFRA